VFEIVIDGLDLAGVEEAMRRGIHAAAEHGALEVSAGNYGGNLGKYHIHLHRLLESHPPDATTRGPDLIPPGPVATP
jgi:hypothetical protein